MWKAALVGAFALATLGTFSHQGLLVRPAIAQDMVVTDAQIARLKAALRLTPEQEGRWRAVAAELHALARHQQHQQHYQVASTDAGMVERAQAKVAGYTVTAMTLQRLKSAAQPLINALTDEQRQAGRDALQAMGVYF